MQENIHSAFKKAQTYLALACIFFVVASVCPWPYLLSWSNHNHQRLVQIILLLVTAGLCVAGDVRQTLLFYAKKQALFFGAFLFFAGGVISLCFTPFLASAALEYLHWILLFVLCFCCAFWAGNIKNVHFFLASFVVVQAMGLVVAMLNMLLTFIHGDGLMPGLIYPGVDNIRTYNQIQCISIPVLLFVAHGHAASRLALGLLFCNFLLLFVGGGRGVCLALVVLFFMLLPIKALRIHLYKTLATAVLAIIAYLLLMCFSPKDTYTLLRLGSSSRIEMWQEILRSLQLHSLLYGIGPSGYSWFNTFGFGGPHNSVLQILLEWGGLALVGFLLFIGGIFYAGCRACAMHASPKTLQCLMATTAAMCLYSLFDGVTVAPIAQTILLILLGLILGQSQAAPLFANAHKHKSVLVAAIIVLTITAPYIYLVSHYYLQQSPDIPSVIGPRFWVNGERFNFI